MRTASTVTVTPAKAVKLTGGPATPKGSRRPSGDPDSLDGLFSQAAARRPGAVVVADGWRTLTYEAAENLSGQLASAMLRSGVQLGDPVLVHCADHAQALVAHLAVLKLGAVCVPVPRGVDDRALARIAAISGAALVLCSGATRERWPLPAMMLDDARTWARIAPLRVDGSLPRSGFRDVAYLLVEQGGDDGVTGHLVDHRALLVAVTDRIHRAGRPERGVTVYQEPGSARTLAAMWWAVAAAGRLHGPPAGTAADAVHGLPTVGSAAVFGPREYAAVLDAQVASMDGQRVATRLGTVLLTGEPCPADLVERHFEALPFTRLLAEFAPRDGAMPWTAVEYTACGAQPGGSLVIGESVARVRVTVRGAEGQSLPSGSMGEIWAAGTALPFDRLRAYGRVPAAGSRGSLADSGYSGRWNDNGALEVTGRTVRPALVSE